MFLLHPLVIPVYSDFNIIYTGKDHTENQQKLLLIGYRIVSFASSEGYMYTQCDMYTGSATWNVPLDFVVLTDP